MGERFGAAEIFDFVERTQTAISNRVGSAVDKMLSIKSEGLMTRAKWRTRITVDSMRADSNAPIRDGQAVRARACETLRCLELRNSPPRRPRGRAVPMQAVL